MDDAFIVPSFDQVPQRVQMPAAGRRDTGQKGPCTAEANRALHAEDPHRHAEGR